MNGQAKCPSCNAWVSKDLAKCPHCSASMDRHVFLQEERVRTGNTPFQRPVKKTRIDLWLDRTENSDNTLVVFFRSIVKVIWVMYMAVLGFIIWFVSLAAG